jgi:hypothetical protein
MTEKELLGIKRLYLEGLMVSSATDLEMVYRAHDYRLWNNKKTRLENHRPYLCSERCKMGNV